MSTAAPSLDVGTKRRRVSVEGVSKERVRAVVLDTASVPGSKCDVRHDPGTDMYDLGDIATACFRSERRANDILRQWFDRKERGSMFSGLGVREGEEGHLYWAVTDEHDDRKHRTSLRVVVSLRVACAFIAHCQAAHDHEPRLAGMRRFLSSRSSAPLLNSARTLTGF